MKDRVLFERFLAGMQQKAKISEEEASLIAGHEPLLIQAPPDARLPGWVAGGEVSTSVASSVETSEETFDFSRWMLGTFSIEIALHFKKSGEGFLVLRWETTTRNPHGWWLTFFRADVEDDEPLCELDLGSTFRGESRLFAEDLSIDPATVPFRYLVHPRLP